MSTDLEKQENGNRSNKEGSTELKTESLPPVSTRRDGAQEDTNIIDWSPNDPENPLNWSTAKRMGHVGIISFITLSVNLAATLFSPAAASLVRDFSVTNSTVTSLTVSIFLLGFALGPLVIAPLSELYGRLWVYHACNICFLAFTIGCAVSPNLGSFLVCRFLAGCGGSAPVTIGGGTIADVTPLHERGKAMALFALGPLLGPVIGPIVGGFVANSLGWRWTLWIIAILSGTNTIVAAVFMRETFAPVLLARRVIRMREQTGNRELRAKGSRDIAAGALFIQAITRPTKLLITNPMVLILSLFVAFVFGLIFLLFTTFPSVFEAQYGFTTSTSGLSFIGMGVGMLLGTLIFGAMSDRIIKSKPGPPKAEYRLTLMVYFSPVIPAGFFWYGWSAYYKTHWIVPIIGTSFIGFGCLFVLVPAQIYLVDAFGANGAASALAVMLVVRSIFGAFLPLAGPQMYEKLGLGWGNSVLGFISFAFVPVPLLFYKYGEFLRNKFTTEF